jgi:hypothetical protein
MQQQEPVARSRVVAPPTSLQLQHAIRIEDDSPVSPIIAKRPYNLRSSGTKSSPSPKEPQEKKEKKEKKDSSHKKPRRE